MSFRARFTSRCDGCDLRIDEGDLCDWDEGVVVHAGCVGASPPARVEKCCPTCHLTSCDCEDE